MAKILEDEPIFGEDYRYLPIVGDSVTYDTPVFIKHNENDSIDIQPIYELFDDQFAVEFEHEQWRDFSKKGYKVLSKNGWCDAGYVYKHKTSKQLKRVVTERGLVDCTEDHSLFTPQMEEKKPSDFSAGDGIAVYDGPMKYAVKDGLDAEIAWLCGFFMTHANMKGHLELYVKTNKSLVKAQNILNSKGWRYEIDTDHENPSVFTLRCYNTETIFWYWLNFYTLHGHRKVPSVILNASEEAKRAFIDGISDGGNLELIETNKTVAAGLSFISSELGIGFEIKTNGTNGDTVSFSFKKEKISKERETEKTKNNIKVLDVFNIDIASDYVYDISCDGTFINALGMTVLHNTDGVNFVCAKTLRYTDEHPYYCTGRGRNGKKGEKFTGVWADVHEFEDTYLVPDIPGGYNKMGLDVDDCIPGNLLLKRKVYVDLLDNGKIKRVGNAIKSRTMPAYIANFLMHSFKLLLYGHGKEFIEYYYDYIEKIYNFKIPLKQIASVGKIKTSLDEYKRRCTETTASGSKKARQAWYELAIKEGLKVNMGDAIYYINTGKKKGDADVQRVTKYFVREADLFSDDNEVDMTKAYNKELNKIRKTLKENPNDENLQKYVKENGKPVNLSEYVKMVHPEAEERDVLTFNCVIVPNELIEDDEEHFCDENFEYNVEKYIDMINKRILNLTVCFDRKMRERVDEKGKTVSNILITNPADRKEFTDEECELIYGQPLNESDQDKLEDVMMPEDKEIRFWLSIGEKPPYVDECGLDWEKIKADYLERQEILQRDGVREEVERYNEFLCKGLTKEVYDAFMDDGEIPEELLSYLEVAPNGTTLVSKKHGVAIGSLMDIVDAFFTDSEEED